MLQYPSITTDPGVEPWKGAADEDATGAADDEDAESRDSWSRKKVERDILKTAEVNGFSKDQVAEWKALFRFHAEHLTSDIVPNLPHSLPLPEGKSLVLNGMP
eukprot:3020013-Pleurochrysis_carterae.AAC.1